MYTVIIRHRGERTLPLIRQILEQSRYFNVIEVSSNAFHQTLEESLELALTLSDPWVIMLDGDVIPSPFLLKNLVKKTMKMDKKTFVVVPNVFDKSFLMTRKAGIHIYNQSYLNLMINKFDKIADEDRPETKLNLMMQECGYKMCSSNIVIGLHDFEQYYKDLWLKGYVFSKKSQYWVKKCIDDWRKKSEKDLDYLALLDGYTFGLTQKLPINLRRTSGNYLLAEDSLEKINLDEKPALSFTQYERLAYILQILAKNLNKKVIKEILLEENIS